MNRSEMILQKIAEYKLRGGLDQTIIVFLRLCSINHQPVRDHCERVALLAEEVAKRLKKDAKFALVSALLHDMGKLAQPYYLFDGRDINTEEYELVKKHAWAGANALRGLHQLCSLCAGIHHNMYHNGYGIEVKDFPCDIGPATVKKVLEIAAIISICDFIDAYTHRKTAIKDGSNKDTQDLEGMLKQKYPNDFQTIEIALEVNNELKL